MTSRFMLAAITAMVLLAPSGSGAVDDAQRTAVYGEFRTAFDAHRYAEALPIAERLVALTEEQYGADQRALVNPLTNLGTTHYRLKSYDAAKDAFTRALSILDTTAQAADRQFIRPLQGLGASYFALGRYDESVTVLKRAVDISRNLDGLFNPGQLEILRPLIAGYDALHRFEDTAKEQQYAYTIAESSFGKDDPRLLPALDAYARWHESMGRYTAARVYHSQAVTLAERIEGRATPLSVEGLRGIARTYRLAFIFGEATDEDPSVADLTGTMSPSVAQHTSLAHPDGERALRVAAQILQAQKPVDTRRLGETLIDLGDWYQSIGASDKAMISYRSAWKSLAVSGDTELLEAPVPLTYRAPSIASARHAPDPDEFEIRSVEVTLNVSKQGETDAVVRSGGDALEPQQRPVISAVKRARYRPRLVDGEPADTSGVLFRELVVVKRKA